MATFKTVELLNKLHEMINDGYELVDISLFENEDDSTSTMYFNVIEDDFESIDYESIDSCDIPDGYSSSSISLLPDDPAPISFSYSDILTLSHAVDNALEYYKECSKDSSYSKEILEEIKTSSISTRNLQAKFAKFLKRLK